MKRLLLSIFLVALVACTAALALAQPEEEEEEERAPGRRRSRSSRRSSPRRRPAPDKSKAEAPKTSAKTAPFKEGSISGEVEEELISLDLDAVDIKYVIKLISDLTGKNFILSDQVRGTVTVMSPTRIPVDGLFKVLESILEVRNLTMVPSGDLIKILPKREGIKSPISLETVEGIRSRAPEDALVTQLIPLQYAEINEIQRVIQALAGRDSSTIPYPPTNTLIVTDTISNIDRLLRIIDEIDLPGLESTITVVPLQYAAASVMAEEILAIVQEKGATGARPAPRRRTAKGKAAAAAAGSEGIKIFADERTNSLIVVASPEDTERILALVEELDQQTPESKTRVRVRRLSYSNSDDVASVLSTLTSGQTGDDAAVVSVTSYPEINALIIDASPQDFELVERIINDLDIPRDQVMVEVIFAEVDFAKSLSAEFQAQTTSTIDWTASDSQKGVDNTQNWGGIEFDPSLRDGIISSLQTGYPPSGGEGINFGYLYTPTDPDSTFFGPYGVLLNALQADTDINVLSAPQVLTSDNEEVSFMVVDNIPIITSTLTTGSGTASTDTIQQIDYRDVGVQIKLIPHISKDRFVRLEIEQKIDSLVGVSLSDISGPLTPATLKRETSTVVTVKDGHTIVISGIISDSYTTQESKVPILGDIPILGLLARFRKQSISKINLMIFITPHIVRNPTEMEALTQHIRNRSNDFIDDAHGRPPRMLDTFIESVFEEPIKKLIPKGEAQKPYGISK